MAVSKLVCPDCQKVLRPAKPLPVGKKVKCPQCGTIFIATDPDPDSPALKRDKKPDSASEIAAAAAAAVKRLKPKKPVEDEDEGAYRVIKDEEDEEHKPQINYAPDMSIKDLRGPAQAIVMKPSNYVILVGILGFIGWLGLTVLILIPILFPLANLDGSETPVLKIGPALSEVARLADDPKKDKDSSVKDAEEDEKDSFFELGPINLTEVATYPWYGKILTFFLIALCLFYCAVLINGAVKMQSLESRPWGFVGAIMALVPLNVGALQFVTSMLFKKVLFFIFDDAGTVWMMLIVWMVLLWLASLAVGIYAIVTLNKPDVVAGFEYRSD
jgi:hypothetical protein